MAPEEELTSRVTPVREDLPLQRKVWRFERVGFVGLLLLIAVSLAGLFSRGPLSEQQVRTPDGRLQVQYQRFSRNGAQDDVVVTANGPPGQMLYLVLGSRWLEGLSIEALNPQPAPLKSQGRDLVVPMLADAHGSAVLYLTLRSDGIGLYRGHIGLQGGQTLDVNLFIYP